MNRPAKLPKLPPVWLVKGVNLFRNALLSLNRRLFPGNVVLYEQFQNFWLLPSLYVAASLDIAGALKNGPKSVAEIAKEVGADSAALYRVLRALSSQGIFRELKERHFRLTPMATGLLDTPGSLRHTLLHHLGPVNWNLMSNLMVAVKSGNDPFADRYGLPIYDYLQQHPEEYVLFDRSMSNLSDLGLAPVLNSYDFTPYKTIVDLGGGEGFLLANIITRIPAARGILFDLPEAVVKTMKMLAAFDVSSRVEIRTGDFFSGIPAEGDLYILKNIIHNWNDEDCIRMLKVVSQAIKPEARILIIDMVVETVNTPSLAPLLDIQMLACMQGGKERTRKEFESLLSRSGFRINRIIRTIAPICLIEAMPITLPGHA